MTVDDPVEDVVALGPREKRLGGLPHHIGRQLDPRWDVRRVRNDEVGNRNSASSCLWYGVDVLAGCGAHEIAATIIGAVDESPHIPYVVSRSWLVGPDVEDHRHACQRLPRRVQPREQRLHPVPNAFLLGERRDRNAKVLELIEPDALFAFIIAMQIP